MSYQVSISTSIKKRQYIRIIFFVSNILYNIVEITKVAIMYYKNEEEELLNECVCVTG